MLIMGKAVLALGIFSVVGAAAHNHSLAASRFEPASTFAIQAPTPAINHAGFTIAAPTTAELPRGYWSNPATSPLQGMGMPAMQPSGPVR